MTHIKSLLICLFCLNFYFTIRYTWLTGNWRSPCQVVGQSRQSWSWWRAGGWRGKPPHCRQTGFHQTDDRVSHLGERGKGKRDMKGQMRLAVKVSNGVFYFFGNCSAFKLKAANTAVVFHGWIISCFIGSSWFPLFLFFVSSTVLKCTLSTHKNKKVTCKAINA